jgi:predicted phosphodiesterase
MSPHPDDTVDSDRAAPARVAVLSDVHGNLPALEAVLAAVEAAGADEIWCLGDLVGYGAQPDECVALAATASELCLVGNHDLAVLGLLDISTFSAAAAQAAVWTRQRIGSDARTFLSRLQPADVGQPVGLYHGSPRNPVWEYVLSSQVADASMDAMDHRVGLIGHSHVALCFGREGGDRASGRTAPEGATADLADGEWILNPGAVGQPRDGDPRAAWLMLDLEQWSASWHRVDYPIDRAAEAIRAAELPAALADRLYYGQ